MSCMRSGMKDRNVLFELKWDEGERSLVSRSGMKERKVLVEEKWDEGERGLV
jgi:hypothetical protein